jgi:hypothetical protein
MFFFVLDVSPQIEKVFENKWLSIESMIYRRFLIIIIITIFMYRYININSIRRLCWILIVPFIVIIFYLGFSSFDYAQRSENPDRTIAVFNPSKLENLK